jgi:hypothetical protein
MVPQILALVISGGGPDGGKVDIGSWPFIIGSLPFVVVICLIVMLTWYFLSKKRFEHQQILAAIEKGTPLSELRPVEKKGVNWIKSLTVGIAFLLMGMGMVIVSLISFNYYSADDASFGLFIASAVFLAIGTAGIIRGILQRKYDKALSSDKSALDANQGQ